MATFTTAARAALLCVSCALCACFDAPSENELRSALRSQMEALGGKQAADTFSADLEKIKLLGCKSADAGGQRCDWTGPMGGGSGRFVKKDGAWHLVGA